MNVDTKQASDIGEWNQSTVLSQPFVLRMTFSTDIDKLLPSLPYTRAHLPTQYAYSSGNDNQVKWKLLELRATLLLCRTLQLHI